MRLSTTKMVFCSWVFCSYKEGVAIIPPSPSDKLAQERLDSITPEGQWIQGDAVTSVRHGVLFQHHVCNSRLTAAPRPSTPRRRQTSRLLRPLATRSISLPKPQLVLPERVLPEEDLEMFTQDGSKWENAQRSYNFSDARIDLLPQFAELSDRPDVCLPNRVASGLHAYNLVGVHPDLQLCLNHVFVRGCEADLLGSLVNTPAFCSPRNDQTEIIAAEDIAGGDVAIEDINAEDNHQRLRLINTTPEENFLQAPTAQDRKAQDTIIGSRHSAGSLTIHIRSGDIFKGKGDSGFGQPPLEFFLDAISSKVWSNVTILTYSKVPSALNPTYKALGLLNSAGMLGPNVDLHHNRSLVEDVKAMLCSDALAVSRSSVHFLTFPHTRATTFFVPDSCGPGRYMRRSYAGSGPPIKKTPDNATLLLIEKPWAEVYGIEWEGARSSYTPYAGWTDTDAQLLEMVTFDGVKGLKRCSIND